ncbi:hypothetical protein AKJ08_1655 [Vulgatibacter incomptus]|uniref:Uncharacterized protein n=1 Tax=Vulgatibacter incomptus TaxID=1391653 RepID=A0A0K1PCK9_9BACT|nr:hypothetical protein AKJ08_1655 [Vulgatibacter incomptus]
MQVPGFRRVRSQRFEHRCSTGGRPTGLQRARTLPRMTGALRVCANRVGSVHVQRDALPISWPDPALDDNRRFAPIPTKSGGKRATACRSGSVAPRRGFIVGTQ